MFTRYHLRSTLLKGAAVIFFFPNRTKREQVGKISEICSTRSSCRNHLAKLKMSALRTPYSKIFSNGLPQQILTGVSAGHKTLSLSYLHSQKHITS